MENVMTTKISEDWVRIDLIENSTTGAVYYKLVRPGSQAKSIVGNNLKQVIANSFLSEDQKDYLNKYFFTSEPRRDFTNDL
jgi:hypothetical protein